MQTRLDLSPTAHYSKVRGRVLRTTYDLLIGERNNYYFATYTERWHPPLFGDRSREHQALVYVMQEPALLQYLAARRENSMSERELRVLLAQAGKSGQIMSYFNRRVHNQAEFLERIGTGPLLLYFSTRRGGSAPALQPYSAEQYESLVAEERGYTESLRSIFSTTDAQQMADSNAQSLDRRVQLALPYSQ